MKRVVVTGIGVVTPLGIGIESYWQNLRAGKSGISFITRFSSEGYPTRIAGEIKHFRLSKSLLAAAGNPRGLFSHYAVQAAAEAWRDAGLDGVALKGETVGVSLGTSRGGVELLDEFLLHLRLGGVKKVNDPLWDGVILEAQPAAATAAVARLIGARGFTST
ncbi:beta-ketoacyl synthase N-terminal-like domain-containing protein, partial [Calderihabitans maritimus]|uniref:beta-ketoacyl synthase N-terminal-like domain-containing protein n=1 Tax=Calderihabitans maritimus TaxID=1246530 RepID=UPI00235323B7